MAYDVPRTRWSNGTALGTMGTTI